MKVQSLIQEIQSCSLCRCDLPLEPRPIFQFSPAAKILIVGQAPGLRAHEAHRPFDDPSGDRLRHWLGVSHIEFYEPENFALLPVAFCYPGTTAGGDLPPSKLCAPKWRTRLLSELSQLKLTLLCGKYAIDCHLPSRRKETSDSRSQGLAILFSSDHANAASQRSQYGLAQDQSLVRSAGGTRNSHSSSNGFE